MTQLAHLTRPFPQYLVARKPGGQGGDYVKHSTVSERLLQILGPYSFEVVELIRSEEQMVTGALCRLTVEIDGRTVQIVEVGDVEHPASKATDGARAKDAASDGLKRCAMRLGCGLHLWSQDAYFLHDRLTRDPVVPAGTDPLDG